MPKFLRSIQKTLSSVTSVYSVVKSRSRFHSRANPAGPSLSDPGAERWGMGSDWAPREYGDYLTVSPVVYACVNLRRGTWRGCACWRMPFTRTAKARRWA